MTKTADAARGKWRGIILQLTGIDRSFLTGKHGPCPMCEGRDRFRFDDREGKGTYFCSGCGAGSGFDLVQKLKGWDFKTAACEVDRIVGNVRPETIRQRRAPEDSKRLSVRLWHEARPIEMTDPVGLYLTHRGLDLPQNRDALRFLVSCPVPGEAGQRMAMLAKIADADGNGAIVHRTFLTPQGRKADMPEPRATMPGDLPDGGAIRLAMHGERLGIAEGIETALAATKRFGIPVWAAVNSTMLKKWQPPESVREVTVFGDNDAKFGGQAAALALAHRLAVDRRGFDVRVEIPGIRFDPAAVGHDWADAA